ncbi:MAG: hypothetical protein CME61_09740, partial [Halobacteriovoraceae bacterium]|nr:hypothetical protein [Halobacteriovoraceae bacterium]
MFVLIITILFLLIVIGLSIFGFFYRNKPGAIIVNPNTHTTKNYCSKKIIECDLNNDNCSDICIETETGVEMSCNPTGDSKRGVCSPQIPKDTCNTPNGALSILTAWGGDGPPAMSWDCFCSEPTLAGANDCSFNPNFCSPNEANNGIKIQGDVLNSENYTCDCAPGQTKIDRGDGKPPLCAPVHVNPLAYINFKNNYKIVEDNSSSKTCTKNSDCPGYNPNWVVDLNSGKIKPHSNIGICVKSNDADNGVCTSMQMPDYKSACDW